MADVPSRWLLPVLAFIRQRPGMYLGGERIERLDCYLCGYAQGRADLGAVRMEPEDEELLDGFSAWLAEKRKVRAQGLRHWTILVQRIDRGSKSVHTFFKLFEEFLRTRGTSFDDAPKWTLRDIAPRP